jgi:hypothetical protein
MYGSLMCQSWDHLAARTVTAIAAQESGKNDYHEDLAGAKTGGIDAVTRRKAASIKSRPTETQPGAKTRYQ